MAVATHIKKQSLMNIFEIVKFQIFIHCYLENIFITDADLKCLTLLAINGETELSDFCNAACKKNRRDRVPNVKAVYEIFSSPQSVRNVLTKIERRNLIVKNGINKKLIKINPIINIHVKGNIVFDIRAIYRDAPVKT